MTNIEKYVELYKLGYSTKQIAKKLRTTNSSIYSILFYNGISINKIKTNKIDVLAQKIIDWLETVPTLVTKKDIIKKFNLSLDRYKQVRNKIGKTDKFKIKFVYRSHNNKVIYNHRAFIKDLKTLTNEEIMKKHNIKQITIYKRVETLVERGLFAKEEWDNLRGNRRFLINKRISYETN